MTELEKRVEWLEMQMKLVHRTLDKIDRKDEPQTESLEQFRVGLEYHTDTTHFGRVKGESITTNKVEDEPQTERSE